MGLLEDTIPGRYYCPWCCGCGRKFHNTESEACVFCGGEGNLTREGAQALKTGMGMAAVRIIGGMGERGGGRAHADFKHWGKP